MIPVQLIAPINNTGVGTHAQGIAGEIVKQEESSFNIVTNGVVRASVNPKNSVDIAKFLMTQEIHCSPMATIVLDVPNKCLDIINKLDIGSHNIAYTVFELYPFGQLLDTLTELQKRYHEVWVPTHDLKNVFPGDQSKIFVVNEGVFDYSQEREHFIDEEYPLLNIVTVGKFEKRKGHYELFKAISKLHDPVMLHAWIYNPFLGLNFPAFLGYMRDVLKEYDFIPAYSNDIFMHPNGSTIKLEAPEQWQSMLYYHIASMAPDIAIFPTYCEGWGLPIIESMAMGIPTITSRSFGPSEYLNDYLSLVKKNTGSNELVKPLTMGHIEPAKDNMFFGGGTGFWQPVDVDEIVQRIEFAIKNKHNIAKRGYLVAGKLLGNKYSWAESFRKICSLL